MNLDLLVVSFGSQRSQLNTSVWNHWYFSFSLCNYQSNTTNHLKCNNQLHTALLLDQVYWDKRHEFLLLNIYLKIIFFISRAKHYLTWNIFSSVMIMLLWRYLMCCLICSNALPLIMLQIHRTALLCCIQWTLFFLTTLNKACVALLLHYLPNELSVFVFVFTVEPNGCMQIHWNTTQFIYKSQHGH